MNISVGRGVDVPAAFTTWVRAGSSTDDVRRELPPTPSATLPPAPLGHSTAIFQEEDRSYVSEPRRHHRVSSPRRHLEMRGHRHYPCRAWSGTSPRTISVHIQPLSNPTQPGDRGPRPTCCLSTGPSRASIVVVLPGRFLRASRSRFVVERQRLSFPYPTAGCMRLT